ncbi:hypothetical protein [Actinoplanes teichomyceticus]|uniref:hypothetical protein n=1 Tax=Actinoplanes teichomyceticus TaxID=1867 RepID=UPI003555F977
MTIYVATLLAVALTWPTLRYPMHTLPQDLGDPSRQAWQVSWLGHVLRTNPVKLWQSNAYFPARDSFAFGDSLLGYAPFGLVGDGPGAAILRYNILFVLAHALLLVGAYALVRQLGARPIGAAVAAAAFAYAPWRLAQEGHLDIVSAGAIPLALAMLARGHGWSMRHGFRPARRHAGWATLGWLVATWQLSLGFSLGLPFAYVLGGIVLFLLVAVPVKRLRERRRAKRNRAAQPAVPSGTEALSKEAVDPESPSGLDPARAESAPGAGRTAKGTGEAAQGTTEAAKGTGQAAQDTTEAAKGTGQADRPEPPKTEAARARERAARLEEPSRTEAVHGSSGRIEPVTPQPGTAVTPGEHGSRTEAAEAGMAGRPDNTDPAGTKAAGDAPGRRQPAWRAPWRRRPQRSGPRESANAVLGWRLLLADILGVLFLAGVGALIAVPYLRVPDSATRTTEIEFFSPPLRSLLIGPAESRIWGAAHATPRASLGWAAEMSLLPGFMLYALALAGLLFSIWRWRQRLFLTLALAVSVILTLGTTFFDGRWTYLPLFGHLPASFDLRIPGRLVLWTTLLLAILAAGAVDEFVRRAEQLAAQRTPPWPGPWMRIAMLVPLLLVILEGWNATAHPVVPAQPAAMRTVGGPMLVLPTGNLEDQGVQLWTTSRYQQVANGGGNVGAVRQGEMRARVASFPDPASIQYLRELGVNTVLLIRSEVTGTVWEQAGDLPVEWLGIRREDLPDAVVFRLN